VLLEAMRAEPSDWRPYVEAGPGEEDRMLNGLSDRLRYYWPRPAVRRAVAALLAEAREGRPAKVPEDWPADPARLPETLIDRNVGAVVARYRQATGG
jgi:D-tagatose-1,6-bisphosphate aldolase subunit GatZ/KbaZ